MFSSGFKATLSLCHLHQCNIGLPKVEMELLPHVTRNLRVID